MIRWQLYDWWQLISILNLAHFPPMKNNWVLMLFRILRIILLLKWLLTNCECWKRKNLNSSLLIHYSWMQIEVFFLFSKKTNLLVKLSTGGTFLGKVNTCFQHKFLIAFFSSSLSMVTVFTKIHICYWFCCNWIYFCLTLFPISIAFIHNKRREKCNKILIVDAEIMSTSCVAYQYIDSRNYFLGFCRWTYSIFTCMIQSYIVLLILQKKYIERPCHITDFIYISIWLLKIYYDFPK